jgi:effector-binding domain-containing protein
MALVTIDEEPVAVLPSQAELHRARRQLNALASEIAHHREAKVIIDHHDRRLYDRAR